MFSNETYEQRRQRAAEVEEWTDDIYRPAPSRYRPKRTEERLCCPGQVRQAEDRIPAVDFAFHSV